jgi:hypothetical protein
VGIRPWVVHEGFDRIAVASGRARWPGNGWIEGLHDAMPEHRGDWYFTGSDGRAY